MGLQLHLFHEERNGSTERWSVQVLEGVSTHGLCTSAAHENGGGKRQRGLAAGKGLGKVSCKNHETKKEKWSHGLDKSSKGAGTRKWSVSAS